MVISDDGDAICDKCETLLRCSQKKCRNESESKSVEIFECEYVRFSIISQNVYLLSRSKLD